MWRPNGGNCHRRNRAGRNRRLACNLEDARRAQTHIPTGFLCGCASGSRAISAAYRDLSFGSVKIMRCWRVAGRETFAQRFIQQFFVMNGRRRSGFVTGVSHGRSVSLSRNIARKRCLVDAIAGRSAFGRPTVCRKKPRASDMRLSRRCASFNHRPFSKGNST